MRTVACVLWHVDCDLWNEKSAMKSCPHRTQESAMWTSSSRSTLMHRDLSITAERESHPGVPPPGGTATAGCDPMSIDPITPGERPDGSVWHSECGEAVSTHRVTDAPWAEHKPVSIMYTLRVWYCGFALLPMMEGTQMNKHIGRALVVFTGTMLAGATLAVPASATPTQESQITVVQSDCADGGKVTIKISGVEYNVSSGVKTAGLAARVNGEVFANAQIEHPNGTYSADEELVIGPFEVDTVIEYRWFAGPIRNDLPMWNMEDYPDWADTVEERESTEERHWDARDDAPFVTWYTFNAKGCPAPADDDDDDVDDVDDGKDDDAGAGGGDADENATLAVTGAPAALIAGAGAALLGAGLVLWWAMKRRTPKFDV